MGMSIPIWAEGVRKGRKDILKEVTKLNIEDDCLLMM